MLFRLILLALAGIYYIAYKLHHHFCLRPGVPLQHAQLIVVGSFLAGGAGKTPFTAWLAQFINAQFIKARAGQVPRIAILCHSRASDEAEMLRHKFAGTAQVHVVATPNRYKTAHEIDRDYDYIICDDGFEDTRLSGATTIRLDREAAPQRIADLVPAGRNRSLARDHEEPALLLQCGRDIRFSIARIENASKEPFDPCIHPDAVLACGIADSQRFLQDVQDFGIHTIRTIFRPDHDRNFEQTIVRILDQGVAVIVTEKDHARLSEGTRNNALVFVAYQKIDIQDGVADAIGHLFGLGA